ncbi:MAG: ATP-binding protein [Chlorobi bacterium]|nr:ATP-binding protein [Chlorobiota bacterium]
MNSPFFIGKVVSGKTFIDRENELGKLKFNFQSGINTMLISSRRWGKSSLVQKVIEESKRENSNQRVCFIDIFKINSELEFYELLLKGIIQNSASKWEDWIKIGKSFLKNLVPVFNIGIDPQHDFSIKLDWNDIKKSPDEILNLPEIIAEKKNIQFVICIDEFQKIAKFKDSINFQQKLRATWQYHNKTSYCLFGSKRHIITDMFQNQSMPFYRFGDMIFLQKISKEHWVKHIVNAFAESGKKISGELVISIIEKVQNHPYYIQQLSHQVWINTPKIVTEAIIETSIDELLLYNGIMYANEAENLSTLQINYLKAVIDKEGKISSKQSVRKYNLGTPGNISRIKLALQNKEIIDFFEKEPNFIDPLFQYWFAKNFNS